MKCKTCMKKVHCDLCVCVSVVFADVALLYSSTTSQKRGQPCVLLSINLHLQADFSDLS